MGSAPPAAVAVPSRRRRDPRRREACHDRRHCPSMTATLWLGAAAFALGCASTGARFTDGPRASTAPPLESEVEASLTVRFESILTTDRFAFEKAEVFLDH